MKTLKRDNKQSKRPIRILQFGEGNFLRAFVDDFLQTLNDEKLINSDICVIQPVEFGRVEDLEKQDGLYTLFLEGLSDKKIVKEHRIINCLSDFINPYKQLDKYLDYAKKQEIEFIISNTTEAGIVFVEEKITNDVTPSSFPGKLLQFMKERFEHFNGSPKAGLEIIACELIDDNATNLKKCLIKLAKYNNFDDNFIKWITDENRYYNTLVDRIVPGYPKNEIEKLTNELGYIDTSIVKGEIFHLWVIEGDDILKDKLPFNKTNLNVHFVDSIKPYKQRKVKILNGSHTVMVPISYLYGYEAVKESIEDKNISRFIKEFIAKEVVPTIDLPKKNMDDFATSVLERYANPFIHHLLISISLNSISKFKSRVLPTILDLKVKNKFAYYSLFSFASLIVFYRGIDENNNKIELNDEKEYLDLFINLWKKNTIEEIIDKVTSLDIWETDYLNSNEVKKYLNKYVALIKNDGIQKALDVFLGGEALE